MRGSIKSQDFKKFIKTLASQIALIPNFKGRAEALFDVHFPESNEQAKAGREYLATEELFSLLLAAKLNREENQKLKTTPIVCDLAALKDFISGLPFKLTNAQRRASWEIIQDMSQETPMNRLLQGDVGSGKTMVAAISSFVAAHAGMQAALMAPTEVLAAQHAESLAKTFGDKLSIALLTGSTKHKTELIPRSLQLTIFGDLSVSILDELPAGRKPIKTKIVSPSSTDQMWDAVRVELEQKRQVYYICKKIEEKGGSELSSVKKETLKIKQKFKDYNVEFLHGKMKPAEKDDIMTRFSKGEIDILVSTTVVEVGVNVPNATVMIIADADQYGLSQLHQLRGRVGRGDSAS